MERMERAECLDRISRYVLYLRADQVRTHLRRMAADDNLSDKEMALVTYSLQYGVGPGDTACQIIADRQDSREGVES